MRDIYGLKVKEHPAIKRIIVAAFPSYKKQSFSLGDFRQSPFEEGSMMAKATKASDVRAAIKDTIDDIVGDFRSTPDVDREDVIERLDEECDTLFGRLVQDGRIDQYDVDDVVRTAPACAAILDVAKEDAWVEDDRGLWEGLTYGVAASIAFFSLRNCLYAALKAAGYDTNQDQPFAVAEERAAVR